MKMFHFPSRIHVIYGLEMSSPCGQYALAEVVRLLKRAGIFAGCIAGSSKKNVCYFRLGSHPSGIERHAIPSLLKGAHADAYVLEVGSTEVVIASTTPKGLLNGVYDLAERMGFLFLYPGTEGEWPPVERGGSVTLPTGISVFHPRFPLRGVMWEPINTQDYSMEEWFRFFAKLRFNTVMYAHQDCTPWIPLARETGLRFETGGHDLSKLLPRKLFAQKPELFRMFQPEDFNGKRTNDSNFCVTHPLSRHIIQKNYRKRLQGLKDVHALHAWPDDLPGGGWCLCPSCRALSPSDQAMLAIRYLAEVAVERQPPMRVPILAYHDTMFPGTLVAPPQNSFLLFAPRERCYGHALDDRACARNRWYLRAMEAWMRRMGSVGDAHTCEYYFDQILYRGMHPFLPGIILRDMRVYEQAGFETHLTLMVAGPAISADFNMLISAAAQWERRLTTQSFITRLAERMGRRMGKDGSGPWRRYLMERGRLFERAMRMCGHPVEIYFDYRWLPESADAFGREMAREYTWASVRLLATAERLKRSVSKMASTEGRRLAAREAGRARFESTELRVMALQQEAMNHLGRFWNGGRRVDLQKGLHMLAAARRGLDRARARALAAGIPESTWYFRNINAWLKREFGAKIAHHCHSSSAAAR